MLVSVMVLVVVLMVVVVLVAVPVLVLVLVHVLVLALALLVLVPLLVQVMMVLLLLLLVLVEVMVLLVVMVVVVVVRGANESHDTVLIHNTATKEERDTTDARNHDIPHQLDNYSTNKFRKGKAAMPNDNDAHIKLNTRSNTPSLAPLILAYTKQ